MLLFGGWANMVHLFGCGVGWALVGDLIGQFGKAVVYEMYGAAAMPAFVVFI